MIAAFLNMIQIFILFMNIFTSPDSHFVSENLKSHPPLIQLNVPYGKDPRQVMDIYLPEGRNPDSTKSLVLIHGGGWNSGNKSDFNAYIDSFRKRMPDYAIFNLNYRLFNGSNLFPSQEEDVKAALELISQKSEEFRINKNKMVLLGASAGAHLSLLQAYKYSSPKIAAVIDFFGPSDLVGMYENPWHPFVTYALNMVTGTTLKENKNLFLLSSPIHFINEESAPTLIFHGANDPVVDISQSKILREKLEKSKVNNELVVYPNMRHGWSGSTLSHSFDQIERFLKANVN